MTGAKWPKVLGQTPSPLLSGKPLIGIASLIESRLAATSVDVAQTKGRLGQSVDGTNFRSDVTVNGSINAADTAIIKQNSGTSLPP